MTLTRDEARILAKVMSEGKYNIADEYTHLNVFPYLDRLHDKLRDAGDDKRRSGRNSMDSFEDLLKRFKNKNTFK
jgi:hypothetical protein